jgi:hypothetical protein
MRIYRALLRLYPASFRDEYGGEMYSEFMRERRDARGPFAVVLLWCRTLADVGVSAFRVHGDVLRQDLRVSFRALRRTPGFTAAALVVTALGVGATTAAFTLTDHVLLRPLPFPTLAGWSRSSRARRHGPRIFADPRHERGLAGACSSRGRRPLVVLRDGRRPVLESRRRRGA